MVVQGLKIKEYPTYGRVSSWDEWKDATATFLPDSLVPWCMSNMVGFGLLWISILWKGHGPEMARRTWGALLLIAGLVNSLVLWTDPTSYHDFGVLSIPPLQQFIYSNYFSNPAYLVVPIILCQWAMGYILIQKDPPLSWLKMALRGAVIWFLGIAPMGLGSAFPSSLLYATTMMVISWQHETRVDDTTKNQHHVLKQPVPQREQQDHDRSAFVKGHTNNEKDKST
jgi:hypothetical protein